MSRIVRSIKNVTNGYSSSQVKVRNVTANDESTPSKMDMQEIADLTWDKHEMFMIMDMLDKRLNDKGKHWRHVLKSLVLLDYLVRMGSDNVIIWCRENFYIIKTLHEFQHREESSGRDLGGAIRARARELTALLQDPERLSEERARLQGRRGMRRRPTRYHSPTRRPQRAPAADSDDDELQRALDLSRETAAQEEEMRRMAQGPGDQQDLQRAIQLSQQNGTDLMGANLAPVPQAYPTGLQGYPTGVQPYGQVGYQQTGYDPYQAQMQAQAEAQAQAQAQAHAQAQELQRQYDEQQAQLQQLEYQQQLYQQQLAATQSQYSNTMEQSEPLKTGSNNPFAAFNQQQSSAPQRQPVSSPPQQPQLRRHKSFSKENTDQLNQILSLEAPSDTFGNTGQARIPAHHTNSYMVDSAGRGLTMEQTMTGKLTSNTATNNPFASQQYTGIATTQMQPAHTGYGFGNANSSGSTSNRSSTNLIDI